MTNAALLEALPLAAIRLKHRQAETSQRPIDDDGLDRWLTKITGRHIPRKAVCPDHDAPFAFVSDLFFHNVTDALVLANRGGGKTSDMAGLHLANGRFKGGFETSHIGAIDIQAHRCYAPYCKGLMHPELRALAPNPHIRFTQWSNGSSIEILPGTPAQTQGGHPHLVAYDELESGKYQPYENSKAMPMEWRDGEETRLGQFVALSTRVSSMGLMQRALDEALEKGTRVYSWCLDPDSRVSTPTGNKRLGDIRPGDKVYGWDGKRLQTGRVTWSQCTGTKRTIELYLETGKVLRCTPDHQVLTERGWRLASDITVGETLMGEAEQVPMRRDYPGSFEALPGLLSLGDSPSEQDSRRLTGSGAGWRNMAEAHIEGGSAGSGVIERDGLGIRCPGGDGNLHYRLLAPRSEGCGRGLLGILAPPANINRTGSTTGIRTTSTGIQGRDTLGRPPASMVERPTRLLKVITLREGPTIPVWDITVEGLHSFVAQGVIVHNCIFETMQPCQPECAENDCRLYQWTNGRSLQADGWRSHEEILSHWRRVGEDTWQAQYLCQKPEAKALIYASFGPANITEAADYVPDAGPIFASYDWGFTDPTHIILWQWRDSFYAFDELVGSNRPEREWVREIVRRICALPDYDGPPYDPEEKPEVIPYGWVQRDSWSEIWAGRKPWPEKWPAVWPECTGDPSAVQMRSELKAHGLGAATPDKVRHNVEQGQDVYRAAICSADGERRIFFHPRCVKSIDAHSRYRARQLADGSFDPLPDPDAANHAFSHGCDSGRYLAWRHRRRLGLGRMEDKDA